MRVRASSDTINDFVPGTDVIDLSAIDANSNLSGNQAFSFAGNVTGAVPYSVTFFASGKDTLVVADTNGNVGVDVAFWVKGTVTLTSSDFVL